MLVLVDEVMITMELRQDPARRFIAGENCRSGWIDLLEKGGFEQNILDRLVGPAEDDKNLLFGKDKFRKEKYALSPPAPDQSILFGIPYHEEKQSVKKRMS